MADDRIKIDTSHPVAEKPQRRWLRWIILVMGLFYLASFLALFPAFMKRKFVPENVEQPTLTHQVKGTTNAPIDKATRQWISPTSGERISLEFVPMGTQALLNLKLSELLSHPESEKILAALGPWGSQTLETIRQWTDLKLTDIDSLLIALHRENDTWQYSLRATLVEPWTQSKLKKLVEGNTHVERVVFSPTSGGGKVVVSCIANVTEELTKGGNEPAVLSRDLQRLLPLTDARRSVTLLIPAKFLDGSGGELLLDGGERLRTALRAIIPNDAAAIAISLDWREHFFCELIATTVQSSPAHRFNANIQKRLDNSGTHMAGFLKISPPNSYDAALAARFPAMIDTLATHTRTSEIDGVAVARAYLPIQAGHNLLLASRLRLGATEATSNEPQFRTIAEKLAAPTTLSFSKETFENAMKTLSDQAKIDISIAGRDLQLEGITKNQTLAVDLRKRPAAEILLELLRRANPDKEATGPGDPRQKLVYVIQGERIVVTTRSAATRDSLELPKEFGER